MKMKMCLKGNFLFFESILLLCYSLALSQGDKLARNNDVESLVRNKGAERILEDTELMDLFSPTSVSEAVRSALTKFLNFLYSTFSKMDFTSKNMIIPGTKWCGNGNISANNSDLGPERETDECCRAHDMCNDIIEAYQTKHGLKNELPFTRLDCSCDTVFHACLKSANTTTSKAIGRLYFNLYGILYQCFKEEHPIVSCNKFMDNKPHLVKRCADHKLNQKMPKKYQWFDLPYF